MNEPILITTQNFQKAWACAVKELQEKHWQVWNLVVQIQNPIIFNTEWHKKMNDFARKNHLIRQEQVAYTIFPYKLYKPGISREVFKKKYNKYFNVYKLKKYGRWGGTYYKRMIDYGSENLKIDQLGTIIDAINSRQKNYGASYAMVIPYPQKDLKRKMGAPCLNYLTVQVEKTENNKKAISVLAVYRNHDFRERAYGNYMGLGKLVEYIAHETNSEIGCLTCISSHAYIDKNKNELIAIAEEILNG